MSYSKEFDTPEIQEKRGYLVMLVNKSVIKPISFDVFKKTPIEKDMLKYARQSWKQAMRAQHGKNWKRFNNPLV